MARYCTGIAIALMTVMAIMWDPPVSTLSFGPTPAEVAWRLWIVQALAASAAETASLREAPGPGEETVGNVRVAGQPLADAG